VAAVGGGGAPRLQERLSPRGPDDPEVLSIAAAAGAGQPAPNLLLAAVHYLLLGGTGHAVGDHYPSVSARAIPRGDPYPAFRAFCREQRDALVGLLATRRVQTNEVGRSACLLPALSQVARAGGGRPLSLIEIGASAGLNLRFDRYRIEYHVEPDSRRADAMGGRAWGDAASPVLLRCR